MKSCFVLISLCFLMIFPLLPLPAQSKDSTEGYDIQKIEKMIFDMVNQERAERKMEPYRYLEALAHIAKIHSTNMVEQNFFSHTDKQGRGAKERFYEYHPEYLGGAGENIAYNFGHNDQAVAANLMRAWMNSSGHRANILSSKYSHMGVGVVKKGQYFYATQNFGVLSAEFLGKIPPKAAYGETIKLKFRFLGNFPKDRLYIYAEYPDRYAKHYTPSGSYYTGGGPYQAQWIDEETFFITLTCDKGAGKYELKFGSNRRFYSPGLPLYVSKENP